MILSALCIPRRSVGTYQGQLYLASFKVATGSSSFRRLDQNPPQHRAQSTSSGNQSDGTSSSNSAEQPTDPTQTHSKAEPWSVRKRLRNLTLRIFPFTSPADGEKEPDSKVDSKEEAVNTEWKQPSKSKPDKVILRSRAEKRLARKKIEAAEKKAIARSREKLRQKNGKSRAEINAQRRQLEQSKLSKAKGTLQAKVPERSSFVPEELPDTDGETNGTEAREVHFNAKANGVDVGSVADKEKKGTFKAAQEKRFATIFEDLFTGNMNEVDTTMKGVDDFRRDPAPHLGLPPQEIEQSNEPVARSYNRSSEPRTEMIKGASIRFYRRVEASKNVSVSEKTSTGQYLPTDQIPAQSDEKRKWWDEEGKWSWTIGGKLSAREVPLVTVDPLRKMEVPQLAHGLDRVLFNPGVHWLRDVRTGIYNFEPRIRNLYDVDLFDYSALPPYQTSSKDPELAELVRNMSKKYSGSTSSMTALLSHIYFLISAWKQPDLSGFSSGFSTLPRSYSYGAKIPASIFLRRFEEQVGEETRVRYAIDADKGSEVSDNNNYVLMQLGKSVEKLLTSSVGEYEKYLRINSHVLKPEDKEKKEAYHYSATNKMLMRSQLDCSDDRLPRKTFDLKTRAVIAVRQDRANWAESSGYMIRRGTGVFESFEREMWDMTRAALLKYYFQARIGDMDGIMVAYHSTATIFGFQYLPCEDMAMKLFGSVEMGDQAFRLTVGFLERILDATTDIKPNHTLKITLDTEPGDNPKMFAFAQAITDDDSEATLNMEAEESTAQDSDEQLDEFSKEGEEAGGQESQIARELKLLQMDIRVDRYLGEDLVRGPVDFSVPSGYKINEAMEDEIARRKRANLPPLDWSIEYSMTPRSDLSDHITKENLRKILSRREGLSPLILPNLEALNEREKMRVKELSKNEAALQKFYEDRRSGLAIGMPPAPGQIEIGGDVLSVGTGDGDAMTASADLKEAKETKEKVVPVQQWKKRTSAIERLRELARLGKEDKDSEALTDDMEMYERRGD